MLEQTIRPLPVHPSTDDAEPMQAAHDRPAPGASGQRAQLASVPELENEIRGPARKPATAKRMAPSRPRLKVQLSDAMQDVEGRALAELLAQLDLARTPDALEALTETLKAALADEATLDVNVLCLAEFLTRQFNAPDLLRSVLGMVAAAGRSLAATQVARAIPAEHRADCLRPLVRRISLLNPDVASALLAVPSEDEFFEATKWFWAAKSDCLNQADLLRQAIELRRAGRLPDERCIPWLRQLALHADERELAQELTTNERPLPDFALRLADDAIAAQDADSLKWLLQVAQKNRWIADLQCQQFMIRHLANEALSERVSRLMIRLFPERGRGHQAFALEMLVDLRDAPNEDFLQRGHEAGLPIELLVRLLPHRAGFRDALERPGGASGMALTCQWLATIPELRELRSESGLAMLQEADQYLDLKQKTLADSLTVLLRSPPSNVAWRVLGELRSADVCHPVTELMTLAWMRWEAAQKNSRADLPVRMGCTGFADALVAELAGGPDGRSERLYDSLAPNASELARGLLLDQLEVMHGMLPTQDSAAG